MKKLIYLVMLFCFQSYAQEISGYLYDSEGRIPNFSIWNASQQLSDTSNEEGYFRLPAVLGDTLVFNSIAYEKHEFQVEARHLREEIVVELKEYNLDEVKIMGNKKSELAIENLDKELGSKLQTDIKKNPHLYKPSNGNILNLIQYAIGLFKKDKEKKIKHEEIELTFSDLRLLFNEDELLNSEFLSEGLKIPAEYHNLFLEYLASKKITSDYLEEERKLDLINIVYTAGAEYQKILEMVDQKAEMN